MAAIKVENYQNIANFYANAHTQLLSISDYYYQAAYEVVLLQIFDPEIDLLIPFYNAYISSQSIYSQAAQSVVSAIIALQNHVLSRARDDDGTVFTDINDWIDSGDTNGGLTGGNGNGSAAVGRQGDSDTSFKVPNNFAVISGQAGFTIDAENIQ